MKEKDETKKQLVEELGKIREQLAKLEAAGVKHLKAEEKLKASLKEKEMLLKEAHHRIKNNLQIIVSLLRLQSNPIKNKKVLNMFRISQNRIRAVALIHEELYRSNNMKEINLSDYVNKMVTHLVSAYRAGNGVIKLKLELKNIFLDIDRAIPCGLVINELVSNSLKHGFPGGREGEIFIKMSRDKRKKYTIIVKDTGMGLPDGLDIHKSENLGLQLVMDLVEQLKGTLELERNGETTFKITF